jgi:hypothetical protein
MHLNVKNQVLMVELVNIVTVNSSLVHPRETFRWAIVAGSPSIIIVHNHPSGEVEPSDEDTKVTEETRSQDQARIRQASALWWHSADQARAVNASKGSFSPRREQAAGRPVSALDSQWRSMVSGLNRAGGQDA